MRAEDLRERLKIEVADRTRGTMGGSKTEWEAVTTIWAEVKTEQNSDAETEGAKRDHSRLKVTIRYRKNLTATGNRFVWLKRGGPTGGISLDIVSVIEDPQHRHITCICVQGKGGVGG